MYGIVLGIYVVLSHLCGLLSFGVPYMAPFVRKEPVWNVGDGILRIPFKRRTYRPVYARKEERLRLRRKHAENASKEIAPKEPSSKERNDLK